MQLIPASEAITHLANELSEEQLLEAADEYYDIDPTADASYSLSEGIRIGMSLQKKLGRKLGRDKWNVYVLPVSGGIAYFLSQSEENLIEILDEFTK